MLKYISIKLSICLTILFFMSSGSNLLLANSQDSITIKKSDYKLSKKEFYAKYAANDTIKQQIIDHYFYKRKEGLQKVSAFPIAVVITGVMVTTSVLAGENSQVASLSYYGCVFGAVGTLISIPVGISGIRICKKYNRKNLCILLKEIESGKKDSKAVLDNFIRYELPDDDDE